MQDKNEQASRIKRVVNSGGGAKGGVYPGAYKAMHDTGVSKGIEMYSGASAGAISSAFMAFNMSPIVFREKLLSTNFQDLMGESVESKKQNTPGVSFITKDGKPMEAYIRDSIIDTARTTLKNLPGNLKDEINKNANLMSVVSKILNTNEPKITFGDLELLNRFFPEQFKQLVLPAVKFPTGEIQIFNSTLTPDVEIAIACRASASLPVILEPVTIDIDGTLQQFVDGGMYDNLPTDYFDMVSDTEFTRNKIPQQTLVFAFGEGLDDKKNPVFQSLYGQRVDESLSDTLIQDILFEAIETANTNLADRENVSLNDIAYAVQNFVEGILNQMLESKELQESEMQHLKQGITESFNDLLKHPEQFPDFFSQYNQKTNLLDKINLLSAYIREKIKPVLYEAGFIERIKRNFLVEFLGDLQTPYKNTDQKEIGFQKLRTDYPLQTVELRVGNIKSTDFDDVTRHARVMDCLGYLDTVNHITNHDLHDSTQFDSDAFFSDLATQFELIYKATLLGSGKNPDTDPLLQEINALREQLKDRPSAIIDRQVYQLIKDHAEHRIDGLEAFALSRALEFKNNMLNSDALFKEVYEEGFKRSGMFSVSKITGTHIFSSSALHEALEGQSMSQLYKTQINHLKASSENPEETRTQKIYEALKDLAGFQKIDMDVEVQKNTDTTPTNLF